MRFAWSVLILTSSLKIKIGDLVKWESVMNDVAEVREHYGVVVAFSRTGHKTLSANVLFTDGETWWLDVDRLEIVNEGG